MGDRKFSWYTVPHPSGMSSLYRLAGPAIEQSGEITCDIYYRPNMKGGHRRNHIINVARRALRNPMKWERVKEALWKDMQAHGTWIGHLTLHMGF